MQRMLEGRVAWVVGAAGALGAEICRRFVGEGAKVVLSGRNRETLEKSAKTLPGGAEFLFCPLDVTSREQVDAAAAEAIAHFGRIDILVNTTTCPIFGNFLELSDDDWMAVINAKALGYMRTARAVLPHMLENGRGVIVNVSGRGGHQPNSPAHMAGSCANAAVNTLTKGLANMYGPFGVRVNAVAPGPVQSPRYDAIESSSKRVAQLIGVNERTGIGITAPLGEKSKPSDIADAALYLASDLSGFVTGVILQADGGATASL